jgi:hypothetical protein
MTEEDYRVKAMREGKGFYLPGKVSPMSTLLSRNPMTFNELLDLFEAYVGSIGGPIHKGHDMLREEIGAGENAALGHIFGVACDAEDMAKRLKHIRAARNTGTDVMITLTEIEHHQIETAIPDLIGILGDTASMLGLLCESFDSGCIKPDGPSVASTLRLLSRALRAADELEVPALIMADNKIRSAASARREAERKAALQPEEVQ